MESKEALNEIKNYDLVSYDENGEEDDCITFGELEPNLIEPIEKDLDKLEKIKAIIKDYESYKIRPYKPYNKMLPAAEDYIKQIKEVLEND